MVAKPQILTSATGKTSTLIKPMTTTMKARKSSIISFKTACTSATAPLIMSNNIAINASAATTSVTVADRVNNEATPWLMLPPEMDRITGDKLECFYSLADGTTLRLNRKESLKVPDTAIFFASTIGSWLGYTDTKDGSLFLSNPFLNEVVELPYLGPMPRVMGTSRNPKSGSILNFKVHMPEYMRPQWNPSVDDRYSLIDPASMADRMISTLALSFVHPLYYDCVAMAIQGSPRRLAYCNIARQFAGGLSSRVSKNMDNDGTFWSGLQEGFNPGCTNCDQVAYSPKDKVFYSFFGSAGIEAFDVERDRGQRAKQTSQVGMETIYYDLKDAFKYQQCSQALKELRKTCSKKDYLVTLNNGDLLLIVRYYLEEEEEEEEEDNEEISESNDESIIRRTKTVYFDVFKVAYPGQLERVTCLKDRAIFIGRNQPFCIKAGGSPGIRPNSIYYTDDIKLCSPNRWGHDNGIFNMSDGVISHCYPYSDEQEEKKVPITAPLFWVALVSYALLSLVADENTLSQEPYYIMG